MRKTLIRIGLLLGAAGLIPACDDGGGGGVVTQVLTVAGALSIDSSGGNAQGSQSITGSVNGGAGGRLEVSCQGSIRAGTDAPPLPPVVPPAPTTGTVVTSFPSPAGYVQGTGNIVISRNVTIPDDAASTSFTITSFDGDIVVSGTLQSGEHTASGNTRHVFLQATLGTVFITGTVRTANVDAVLDGNRSGNLTISARQIVVTGEIDTRGEANDSGAGGAGGAVWLNASSALGDVLVVGGTILTSGGTATATSGGNGGNITVDAGVEAHLHGRVTSVGGAVTATGDVVQAGGGGSVFLSGPGGVRVNVITDQRGGDAITSGSGATGGDGGDFQANISWQGPVTLYGTIGARGGNASATNTASGDIAGGWGGYITIGDLAPWGAPVSVDLGLATWTTFGGAGATLGGAGGLVQLRNDYDLPGGISFAGTIDASGGFGGLQGGGGAGVFFYADQGDLHLSGSVAVRGGDSNLVPSRSPGAGFGCGNGTAGDRGSIFFSGSIEARGGSSRALGNVNGGSGGTVFFDCSNPTGSLRLLPGSTIDLGGGIATGSGTGGGGGRLELFTQDAGVSVAGTVRARGGAAGASGTGGTGGMLDVRSDQDADGIGGDITLETASVLDVSGGAGGTGGNGGTPSVSLDADGNDSNSTADNGIVANFGSMIARGGVANGSGGNVLFDGLKPDLTVGPNPEEPSGTAQDRSGDGSGSTGSFTPQ